VLQANASAEAHRLAGDLDERLDDPLAAVHEYEVAARLDGSEENYFAWGTELLLHRAAQPAVEVFENGVKAHPDSSKLLTGLGAALYASGAHEEAATRLCHAADLKPDDAAPYIFLGKIEKSEAGSEACSEEQLARFAARQPGNALANYYYGLILWKKAKTGGNDAFFAQARSSLEKSVELDPKFAAGYVQLGILNGDSGDLAGAVREYQKAIAIDPQLAEAHYRLAQAYQRTSEDAKAKQEMQTYKEIEKNEARQHEREQAEMQEFLIIMKNHAVPTTPH
jgi:tetratricopeptide (TPR) repeat protein